MSFYFSVLYVCYTSYGLLQLIQSNLLHEIWFYLGNLIWTWTFLVYLTSRLKEIVCIGITGWQKKKKKKKVGSFFSPKKRDLEANDDIHTANGIKILLDSGSLVSYQEHSSCSDDECSGGQQGLPWWGIQSVCVSTKQAAGLGDKTDQSSADRDTAGACLCPQGPFTLPTERNKFNRKKWRKNDFRTACMAAARVFIWKGETKECEITGGILYFSLDLWKWSFPSTDMYHTPVQHRLSAKVHLACLTEHSFSHGVHCWSCENRGMLGYIIQYLQ